MRKAVMPLVVSMALITVWAAPADAASTRAEYIAQVDPICQSFEGPVDDGWAAYVRNFKRWVRAAKHGTPKAIVRGAKRTARSLAQWAQTLTRLFDQIAAVPPPAEDAATLSAWTNHRRQANAYNVATASAIRQGKIAKADRLVRQADAEAEASERAISGFGFQVCERVTRSR
jgi:hypothetical protein